ncbi:MAG TPA: 4Fe-4S dicluster domain-containing protein [Actinomycetota bacterium]|nr:4Fe-4S dicluster domain-containing protein [Actinomycetota bacterium]
MRYLDRSGFEALLLLLADRGYEVIGPTVRDGAIVLDRIDGIDDLPRGIREIHEPGSYRLEQAGDDRFFAWAHGPDAGKRFLFPARETVMTGRREAEGGLDLRPEPIPEVRYAFVGLRSCDLHAIEIQDRVFLNADPAYRARRENAVFIGVNCEVPGATCFCTSMGTGPRCSMGFDLALTELEDGGFTAEAGTDVGEELLRALGAAPAGQEQAAASFAATSRAVEAMGRELDTSDLPALLYRNREHPRWDDVASRCLTCTNCTMVCPTCFCHDLTDEISLDGLRAARTREWASCFSEEFSHMSFGEVRSSPRSRYRQWLTHKFASWIDQFGTSGCVGCGRCVTWCPVGIDVTEEIAAIRAADGEVRLADEVTT